MITGPSSSGSSLDLSSVAHEPFAATQVYKNKCCEMCGKNFLTLTMAALKDCEECIVRQEAAKSPVPASMLGDHRQWPHAQSRAERYARQLAQQRDYCRRKKAARSQHQIAAQALTMADVSL